jgi:hypothetical protein
MFDGSQSPVPAPPDPLETQLGQEWTAAQLAQQHVGEVMTRILEAWRRDRAEMIRLRSEIAELRKAAQPAEPS